jgi:hypothetical protein
MDKILVEQVVDVLPGYADKRKPTLF